MPVGPTARMAVLRRARRSALLHMSGIGSIAATVESEELLLAFAFPF